jgi:Cu/Ag efflux protein CusF
MRGLLRRTALSAVWGLALAAGPLACGGAPEDHPGRGVVESIDAGARTVTLDHGDIPGLMQAMTMTFDLAPGVAVTGLAPGAEVEFKAREEGGRYVVTEIRPLGP